MNLKQLEYFVRVADLSSFSRAALQLGLPQPALSRHVRQLELELRQTLLLRNGRGATPTDAGKLFLSHARGILHQIDLAKESMDQSRGQLSGRVAMGLPPSLSRRITVPLMRAFKSELPRAQLFLTEGFSVAMFESLRLGNLDLALLYNPEFMPDLEQTCVHEEALVLISGPTSAKPIAASPTKQPEPIAGEAPTAAITLAQVADLPLILPSRPNAFRILLEEAMVQRKLKPNIALEVDGLNAILSLVQADMGHAILPRYTADANDLNAFRITPIVLPQLISKLMLVKSALRPTTPTQQQAIDVLHRVVKAVI